MSKTIDSKSKERKILEEAAIRIITSERGQAFHSEIACFKLGVDWHTQQSAADKERIKELEKALKSMIDLSKEWRDERYTFDQLSRRELAESSLNK